MLKTNKIARLFFAAIVLANIPILAVHFGPQLAMLSTNGLLAALGGVAFGAGFCLLKRNPFAAIVFGTIAGAVLAGHYFPTDAMATCYCIAGTFFGQAFLSDVLQSKHSIERAAPLLAHFRRFAEEVRPELQAWVLEGPQEGTPATLDDRSDVYQKSKKEANEKSFGTDRNYTQDGQFRIPHADFPIADKHKITYVPRVVGAKCATPMIVHGVLGVGDMSFGSLGQAAVESLTTGAAYGLKFMDPSYQSGDPTWRPGNVRGLICTGEGGLTPYHLNGVFKKVTTAQRTAWALARTGSLFSKKFRRTAMPTSGYLGSANIIWEIGTGKFGARNPDGSFNFDVYAEKMKNENVVATKLKLSQGAKPGGGGILPGAKVTKEIADIRLIPEGKDCHSPNCFDEFHDVPTLMAFIKKLREISGKPVGVKFAVGKDTLIRGIAKFMAENPDEGPDFIHIDGGEGGTGAAPLFRTDYVGQSILHSLPLVDGVLREFKVRDRVFLMSSGKVFNPAQLFIHLALGSDYVFGARGFMFALGCIQAKKCATGHCPTGVTTHDKWLQRALVPTVKYVRVGNWMERMHQEVTELMRTAGVWHPWELNRSHIQKVGRFEKADGTVVMEPEYALVDPYPAGCDGARTVVIPEGYSIERPNAGTQVPAAGNGLVS